MMKHNLLRLNKTVFARHEVPTESSDFRAAELLQPQAASQRREQRKMGCVLSALCFVTSAAFAIPTPQQEQGGEAYTKEMCVQSYTERCINLTCLNSESTSCTQDCERAAKDKCASIHN